MMRTLCAVTRGRGILLGACCWMILASSLQAEPPATIVLETTSSSSQATDRDALYDEISLEVEHLERQFNLLKKVVRVVRPTVVHIEARKDEPARYSRRPIEEAGSGVVIQLNNRFYILTNRHVIQNALLDDIKIKFSDGRVTHPMRVWSDRGTDVAVMAVAEDNLIAARVGDSARLEIGDFVLAVGSPFGLSHSVTYGIISAKGRRDLELGDDGVRYQDFLQTDAAINPGNSGGPLLSLRGEVVGINTAIASASGGNEGIGFSIPINMAMLVTRQLVEQGYVSRAYLGVQLDADFSVADATRLGMARLRGARVSGITPNSPAELAEFEVDDVILQFDDHIIEDDSHLINRVSLTPIGSEVEVVIFREGRQMRLRVRVGDRSMFEVDG